MDKDQKIVAQFKEGDETYRISRYKKGMSPIIEVQTGETWAHVTSFDKREQLLFKALIDMERQATYGNPT